MCKIKSPKEPRKQATREKKNEQGDKIKCQYVKKNQLIAIYYQ